MNRKTSKVVIYTTAWCPYCIKAKALLSKKNINYTEIRVDLEPWQRSIMIEKSGGRRTVPQIFIDNEAIGGCADLFSLDQQRKLDDLFASI
ncbi:glutaredoxin 3 [Candidatus Nitrosacidococcus tergens]|uniref:Glutaredoxin n=1 Tax=Candidatus Nitrosacidococcus tergens TaxID=553981 RepID=A0A7G1Q762_9GAMM|nr:glutaredoxin 3 [Candidatus Nitrosacidococcus tergens]CAB1274125.1 glutaredoxin 3 [Candidatus Nitrosacidococcus tergens]